MCMCVSFTDKTALTISFVFFFPTAVLLRITPDSKTILCPPKLLTVLFYRHSHSLLNSKWENNLIKVILNNVNLLPEENVFLERTLSPKRILMFRIFRKLDQRRLWDEPCNCHRNDSSCHAGLGFEGRHGGRAPSDCSVCYTTSLAI